MQSQNPYSIAEYFHFLSKPDNNLSKYDRSVANANSTNYFENPSSPTDIRDINLEDAFSTFREKNPEIAEKPSLKKYEDVIKRAVSKFKEYTGARLQIIDKNIEDNCTISSAKNVDDKEAFNSYQGHLSGRNSRYSKSAFIDFLQNTASRHNYGTVSEVSGWITACNRLLRNTPRDADIRSIEMDSLVEELSTLSQKSRDRYRKQYLAATGSFSDWMKKLERLAEKSSLENLDKTLPIPQQQILGLEFTKESEKVTSYKFSVKPGSLCIIQVPDNLTLIEAKRLILQGQEILLDHLLSIEKAEKSS